MLTDYEKLEETCREIEALNHLKKGKGLSEIQQWALKKLIKNREQLRERLDPKAKVKSAVYTTVLDDGFHTTTVGLTRDNKTLLFFSRDYDRAGNVYGPYKELPYGKDAFYMAGYEYKEEGRTKLGYSIDAVNRIQEEIKSFMSREPTYHSKS